MSIINKIKRKFGFKSNGFKPLINPTTNNNNQYRPISKKRKGFRFLPKYSSLIGETQRKLGFKPRNNNGFNNPLIPHTTNNNNNNHGILKISQKRKGIRFSPPQLSLKKLKSNFNSVIKKTKTKLGFKPRNNNNGLKEQLISRNNNSVNKPKLKLIQCKI